jgi:hypothetical protein
MLLSRLRLCQIGEGAAEAHIVAIHTIIQHTDQR